MNKFPFHRGKGTNQPPFEKLKDLESSNQRADEVSRWRRLTHEEQWSEREALGHKRPITRKRRTRQNSASATDANTIDRGTDAFFSLATGYGADESLELSQPMQEVVQNDESVVIPFFGYLDNFEAREKANDRDNSKKKRENHHKTGHHPETSAQIKGKSTSRVRKRLIQNFFRYVQITTPGDIDLKGHSTKDWPSVKVLLVVLDGFKPKRADGGRRKNGSERRDKPMTALISASENVCGDVLHAIHEGVLLNYSNYEPRFAYSSSEAISSMTDFTYENSLDENEEPTVEAKKINWSDERSLLHQFPLWKGKGRRPIPFEHLSQYGSDKSRKKAAYQWRGYTEKAQLELEKKFTGDSVKIKKALDRENNTEEELALEKQKWKKRAVGSQPCTKGQINDRVSRRMRALLINRLYLDISMTTPQNVDKQNKSTADWPQLKVGLFIIDECKPNLSSGGAYRKGKERREKTLVTLMTGSEKDKSEILDALVDGIMSGNEPLKSHYDPVLAFNVDDAVKTEYEILTKDTSVHPE
mmetsp:Transcript_8236/g.11985  ORF Transcript_8236/g.11985 Transcript_8236/m.11985 type:complete len:529 (+) Transcript_8236:280-1866(+)